MQVTTIGLDIAKNVFQVHAIDAAEKVVVRKQLRRSQVLEFFKALPACLVGMEACATAHYWTRELTQLGHQAALADRKFYICGKASTGTSPPRAARPSLVNQVNLAELHSAPAAAILNPLRGRHL